MLTRMGNTFEKCSTRHDHEYTGQELNIELKMFLQKPLDLVNISNSQYLVANVFKKRLYHDLKSEITNNSPIQS